jgi:hypothetical protein
VIAPDEGDVVPRPPCRLTGTDGNVFAIIGKVLQVLCDAGQSDRASEFVRRAFDAGSYDAVLQLCFEYVEVE